MKTINNNSIEARHVTFEPGNATRYDLALTKISGQVVIITDLTNRVSVFINPDHISADGLELDLVEAGYGRGDARPMAEFLEDVLNQTHYIEYEIRTADSVEVKTKWFKSKSDLMMWEMTAEEVEIGATLCRGTFWE